MVAEERKSSWILVFILEVESAGFPDSWWMGEKEGSRRGPGNLAWATGRIELSSGVGGTRTQYCHMELKVCNVGPSLAVGPVRLNSRRGLGWGLRCSSAQVGGGSQ